MRRTSLRAVLFDWDGTLLDSYHADSQAYLHLFRILGIPWGLEDLERHYSPDWHNVYRAAGLPQEKWADADRLWRAGYREHRPVLQRGADHLVRGLAASHRVGLVTSGSRVRVRTQLQAFGLDRIFSVLVFGDEVPRRKPHPEALWLALSRIGIEPASAVYVGDAPEDVVMARRAGVVAVGVTGHSPVPQRLRDSRPDALIDRITALPHLLAGLGR
jgi:HAD superfamily hydrolase (TIGR01509 family)